MNNPKYPHMKTIQTFVDYYFNKGSTIADIKQYASNKMNRATGETLEFYRSVVHELEQRINQ